MLERECDRDIWHAYERHMRAENLSGETVTGYRNAIASLSQALPDDTDLYEAGPDDIAGWLAGGAAGELTGEDGRPRPAWADSTHATYARRARTFYTWALEREWIDKHPMRTIGRVRETQRKMPVPDARDVVTLIESIRADGKREGYDRRKGFERRFRARRDLAMIAILCEPGSPRATELATIAKDQLDTRRDRITLMSKGRRERVIPYGDVAATAIGLYLRARKDHKKAASPELFLSCSSAGAGKLTRHGVAQIVKDRCDAAGIPRIHPHAFRHMTAHEWFAAGGSETDAMELFGWKSWAMTRRYAAATAAERAIGHAAKMSLGDQLMSGKTGKG